MIPEAKEISLIISVIVGAVVSSTPLFYTAFGEAIAERSGVINIGLEGIMLLGAVTAVITNFSTKNSFISVVVPLIVGLIVGAIYGFLSVYMKVNQIGTGFAIVLLGQGISGLIGASYVGTKIPGIANYNLPILSTIPILGEIFFQRDIFVYCSYILIPLAWIFMNRTKIGIALRACGEDPMKAFICGVNVRLIRFMSVIFGSACASLAGAYLSLVYTQGWTSNMVAGRGWISLALVILSKWNPVVVIFGAYLFGAMWSLTFNLQTRGIDVSFYLLSMVPYIITIIAMIIATRRLSRLNIDIPVALGKPFYYKR